MTVPTAKTAPCVCSHERWEHTPPHPDDSDAWRGCWRCTCHGYAEGRRVSTDDLIARAELFQRRDQERIDAILDSLGARWTAACEYHEIRERIHLRERYIEELIQSSSEGV